MVLTAVSAGRPMPWGPAADFLVTGTGTGANVDMNDADNAAATIFTAPQSGSIDRVGIRCNTVTGTPPAYTVGLYAVDAAGLPTTTPYGGMAPFSWTPVAGEAASFLWKTLATPAAAVAGDLIAAVVRPSGSAPNGSNFVQVESSRQLIGGSVGGFPYPVVFSTAWARAQACPTSPLVRYSDDVIAPSPMWAGAIQTANFHSGTTPDEYGARFTLPFGVTCVGVRFLQRLQTAGPTFTCHMLSGADVEMATSAAGIFSPSSTGTLSAWDFYWTAPVNLDAATVYRATHVATNAVSRAIGAWAVPDTASKGVIANGAAWDLTQRTDGAGAWTDTPLAVPLMALLITHIDLTAAAGGGGIPVWSE